MIYGLDQIGGNKITATPRAKAICPHCNDVLIAKCGKINIWHWAHEKGNDCDVWSEGETKWHLDWKSKFPVLCTEFQLTRNNIKHRADVYFPSGLVLEFQHSSISVPEIQEREQFYKNMIWIFDIRKAIDWEGMKLASEELYLAYDHSNFDLRKKKDNFYTFRWKHARKTIAYAQAPVYLDLGNDQLFQLIKMYPDAPTGGKGYLRNKTEFIERLLQRNL